MTPDFSPADQAELRRMMTELPDTECEVDDSMAVLPMVQLLQLVAVNERLSEEAKALDELAKQRTAEVAATRRLLHMWHVGVAVGTAMVGIGAALLLGGCTR